MEFKLPEKCSVQHIEATIEVYEKENFLVGAFCWTGRQRLKDMAEKKERMSQHSSFSLTKPIKLIKPKLMN